LAPRFSLGFPGFFQCFETKSTKRKRTMAQAPSDNVRFEQRASWLKRITLRCRVYDSLYGCVSVGEEHLPTKTRLVALKISRRNLVRYRYSVTGVRVKENPRQEAQILRHLQASPYFVNLYDEFCDEDFHILVLELCRGGEMYNYIRTFDQGLPEARCLHFFRQLIEAVRVLHDRVGIAHMDISLENLLLDAEQNEIKLCDFGLARKVNYRFETSHPIEIGKKKYMAPELHRSFTPGTLLDLRKADIFSMFVVLFMMCTGRPPFLQAMVGDTNFDAIQTRGGLKMLIDFICDETKTKRRHISKPMRDLMFHMSRPTPSQRYNLVQVAAHPWVQGQLKDTPKNTPKDGPHPKDGLHGRKGTSASANVTSSIEATTKTSSSAASPSQSHPGDHGR